MLDLNKLAKPDKTIRMHTDELLEALERLKELDYISTKMYKKMKLACEYHDYGKVNNEFQKRVSSKKKIYFNESREVAHNVLSICFIDKTIFESRRDYYLVVYAVLNHHHYVNNFEEISEKKDIIKKFAQEYSTKMIKERLIEELYELKEDKEAQMIKGFLHKCDYAASGEYDIEYPNDFLKESLAKLSYKWNALQKFTIKNRDKNIMVVANTGMGKTEAGLLWIGDNKGFFILPLKTAINVIYKRIRDDIVKVSIEKRVALLHSDVLSYYTNEKVTEDNELLKYAQRGKDLSMPLTISTLDQIFNFVYKYEGFELKLATMSYSKIVIDEIQAYSPDLLAYLILGLEKIVDVGGKFAILTATLAPFIRDYISENIGEIEIAKFTEGKNRHNVKVIEEEINAEFIYQKYNEKKGKVLVVCNTVKKAQEIYFDLQEKIDKDQLNLLHAKFIKNHRAKKEKRIMEFGKTEILGNGIWISTSLVEASLDIDFDYLFTELNDLNGFFQRLGRVNRKGEKAHMLINPNAYVFTEIKKALLVGKNDRSGFIDKTIYDISKQALLNEVQGILSETQKVELIEKYLTSQNILNSNFDTEYRKIKKYIADLYIGEEKLERVKKKFRNIISYDVIPELIYEENKDIIETNRLILMEKHINDSNKTIEENKNIKEKLKIKKIKAREKIKGYTVGVGIYDVNKTGNTLDLGYEKIEVVKCKYSEEFGFERIKLESKQDDSFDNFI